MIMNTEEFKMASQRLQREHEEFLNNICDLIKHAKTVEQKAQEQYAEGYQKGLEDAWKLAGKVKKEQPQEKIKIGDVVDYDGCEFVVIKELDDFYGVINPTTNCCRTIFKNATKTGKHYDLPWLKKCQ